VRTLLVTALVLAVLAVVVGWAAPAHKSSSAAATGVSPRPASGPLETGIFDPFLYGSADQNLAFQRTKAAGASTVVLNFSWRDIVKGGNTKPANFDATDPASNQYKWQKMDGEVQAATANGLQPIALVSEPPDWAAGQGVYGRDDQPSPGELNLFAIALAKRYSGNYQGLPRVRYWSLWNEPNLPFYLEPQIDNSQLASPAWYRDMVNGFAAGIHSIASDDMVVAGNLAPFTSRTGTVDRWGLAPLVFMRSLLCLNAQLQPTCNNPVHFDIWAHHPYTSGGPNHHATLANDVSLGDLPEMRKVLVAGIKAGHVISTQSIKFWVTEFSWDSNPPDPGGLKPGLGARWTAEALYRMWRAGVTMVAWFLVTDQPRQSYFAQSGLYLRGSPSPQNDKAKSILQSFRFPFVAYQIGNPKAGSNRSAAYPKNGIRVLVWGRVPTGARDRVIVEQRREGTWRPVATMTTNRYGIFGRKIYAPTKGSLRARALGVPSTSHVFSLARPKDRFVSPFGEGWGD
jgi:hypothetical protein